eukprot:200327-Amphidinium_carterae.1
MYSARNNSNALGMDTQICVHTPSTSHLKCVPRLHKQASRASTCMEAPSLPLVAHCPKRFKAEVTSVPASCETLMPIADQSSFSQPADFADRKRSFSTEQTGIGQPTFAAVSETRLTSFRPSSNAKCASTYGS